MHDVSIDQCTHCRICRSYIRPLVQAYKRRLHHSICAGLCYDDLCLKDTWRTSRIWNQPQYRCSGLHIWGLERDLPQFHDENSTWIYEWPICVLEPAVWYGSSFWKYVEEDWDLITDSDKSVKDWSGLRPVCHIRATFFFLSFSSYIYGSIKLWLNLFFVPSWDDVLHHLHSARESLVTVRLEHYFLLLNETRQALSPRELNAHSRVMCTLCARVERCRTS